MQLSVHSSLAVQELSAHLLDLLYAALLVGFHDVRQSTKVFFALLHYLNVLVLCLTALRPFTHLGLALLTLCLGARLLLETLQRAQNTIVVVGGLLVKLFFHLGQPRCSILGKICELCLQFLNALLGLALRLLVLERGVFQFLLELISESAQSLTELFAHVFIVLTHLTLRI